MDAKIQVFAVLRIDTHGSIESEQGWPQGLACPVVTVKEVLPSFEEAEREAERLNQLQEGKGCYYFAQATRFFPFGRKAIR